MGRIKENINQNISKNRRKVGLSQKELAEILNTKPSTVSSWEQGASTPNAETLYELCKIFKISITEMYGINEDVTEYQFAKVWDWLENAGYSLDQDEDNKKRDDFQICDEERGTIAVMQKQDLITLIEKLIQEAEGYKEKLIVDKIKLLFSSR